MAPNLGRHSKSQIGPPISGTQALSRAVRILQAFTEDRPTWTLATIVAELDLRKTTAHRTLSVLEREGFLSRKTGGIEYRLGPELIVLGARALKATDVRDVARPELQALAKATGLDLTLDSPVGWEVLLLQEVRDQSILGMGTPVGTLWPAHASGTGKALMAFAEEPLEEPPGGLVALTEHTITSWEEWKRALAEIRAAGYATNIEELEYGYTTIAAPVRDRDGRAIAAISIGGPVHRMGKDRIPELAKVLKAAALRISESLGYRGEKEETEGPLSSTPN